MQRELANREVPGRRTDGTAHGHESYAIVGTLWGHDPIWLLGQITERWLCPGLPPSGRRVSNPRPSAWEAAPTETTIGGDRRQTPANDDSLGRLYGAGPCGCRACRTDVCATTVPRPGSTRVGDRGGRRCPQSLRNVPPGGSSPRSGTHNGPDRGPRGPRSVRAVGRELGPAGLWAPSTHWPATAAGGLLERARQPSGRL